MSPAIPSVAILYDGSGVPINGVPAPSLERMFELRPACVVIFDYDDGQAAARDDVDLILSLPGNGLKGALLPELGQIVACLDRGGKIAVHGATDEQVQDAIAQILTMAGGAHV